MRPARSGSRRRSGGGSGSPSCGTWCGIATGSVAHDPPRSTLYSGPKNTSEYSRYGNDRETRVRRRNGRRPLPDVAEQLLGAVRARAVAAQAPTGAGPNCCWPRFAGTGRARPRRPLPTPPPSAAGRRPSGRTRRLRTSTRAARARRPADPRVGRTAAGSSSRGRPCQNSGAVEARFVRHAHPAVGP